MDESFSAFAIVELPRRPVGTDARQYCYPERATRPSVVAFWPAHVAGDAVGIPWYGYELSTGRRSSKDGKGLRVCVDQRHCRGEGFGNCGGPYLIVDEINCGTVDSAGADLIRCTQAGDRDQQHTGGVVDSSPTAYSAQSAAQPVGFGDHPLRPPKVTAAS
jgi:hypothetical protein